MRKPILGIIVVLLLSAFAAAQSKQKDVALKDLHGRAFKLSDYKGKVVLLNFWATWCPPCRKEIPDLIELNRQYRRAGLQIIGITYPPEKLSAVRAFARRSGANYPFVLGDENTKLTFTSSEVLPITVVVGRDGNVRDVIEGILLPEEFEAKIKPLLLPLVTRQTDAKEKPIKVTIKVTSTGYSPSSIRLRKGTEAELTFVRTTDQTCGTELKIPAFGIQRPLPLNEPVTVTLKPSHSGTYKITCGMDMFRGSIVVR